MIAARKFNILYRSTCRFQGLISLTRACYRNDIISIAMDAPADTISALSGKIDRLPGVTAKTVYAPEEALGGRSVPRGGEDAPRTM